MPHLGTLLFSVPKPGTERNLKRRKSKARFLHELVLSLIFWCRLQQTVASAFTEKKLGVEYDDVPDEVLQQGHVDLSVWSVMVEDETLIRLAEKNDERLFKLQERKVHAQQSQLSFDDLMSTLMGGPEEFPGTHTLILRNATAITDFGLKCISDTASSTLKSLDLSNCNGVTDKGLRAIALNCHGLECLKVANMRSLDGAGLASIADACPGLKELDLSGCSQLKEWTLQRLAERCPNLEKIDMSGCYKLTDTGLKSIAHHCPR